MHICMYAVKDEFLSLYIHSNISLYGNNELELYLNNNKKKQKTKWSSFMITNHNSLCMYFVYSVYSVLLYIVFVIDVVVLNLLLILSYHLFAMFALYYMMNIYMCVMVGEKLGFVVVFVDCHPLPSNYFFVVVS